MLGLRLRWFLPILLAGACVGVAAGSATPAVSTAAAPVLDRCAGPCWISLGKRGAATGIVTSEPAGMSCGTTCQWGYTHGTSATLVATPDAGARLTRWEGDACAGSTETRCTVFLDEGKSITAVFDLVGGPDTPPAPPPPPPPPPPSGGPGPTGSCTITGTPGKDELTGTRGADVICGLGGADHIHGAGGDDVLKGGDGADELEGEAGADRIDGGAGADTLTGGSGADRIVGGPGRDVVRGDAGPDTFLLRDGTRDVARGGPGVDRARSDRRDALSSTERRF